MKSPTICDFRWELALWVSFLAIAAVFAFGSVVDVDFVDPSVPLSQAWQSARWERALQSFRHDEYGFIWTTALAALLVHTFHQSRLIRLAALVAGFLAPVLSIGVVMFAFALFSPWIVANTLLGNVDGEFYEEEMLQAAAVGLWMLASLASIIREGWGEWKARRRGGDLAVE